MGFPYWLAAKNPKMVVRSMDETYKYYVKRWFDVLLPKIVPLTYENGGPVIMVQVENEYGSYTSNPDVSYIIWLRDLFQSYLGQNFLLTTEDGCGPGYYEYLKNGPIANLYPTVDFGPGFNITNCFGFQRKISTRGPLINTEYYPGWFDSWGIAHNQGSDINKTFIEMLQQNVSVSL